MLSTLIQAVGIITILAIAGALLLTLFSVLRHSDAREQAGKLNRVRSALFKTAGITFALVILLTLIEFMIRAINEPG